MQMKIAEMPFGILDLKGELVLLSNSLNTVMLAMRHRWGGKAICLPDGKVLFDLAVDRHIKREYPTSKEVEKERRLAWERYIETER